MFDVLAAVARLHRRREYNRSRLRRRQQACNGPAPRCAAWRMGSTRHVEMALPIFSSVIAAAAAISGCFIAQSQPEALSVIASPWSI